MTATTLSTQYSQDDGLGAWPLLLFPTLAILGFGIPALLNWVLCRFFPDQWRHIEIARAKEYVAEQHKRTLQIRIEAERRRDYDAEMRRIAQENEQS